MFSCTFHVSFQPLPVFCRSLPIFSHTFPVDFFFRNKCQKKINNLQVLRKSTFPIDCYISFLSVINSFLICCLMLENGSKLSEMTEELCVWWRGGVRVGTWYRSSIIPSATGRRATKKYYQNKIAGLVSWTICSHFTQWEEVKMSVI